MSTKTQMGRIIFYHPKPLVDEPKKGSELRPVRMLQGFRNIGFEVDLVTGESKQRRKRIKTIKRNIRRGIDYDFLYGESTNMPIPLTDSHHFPLRPFQDFLFLRFVNRQGISSGLFYRDLYWQVDNLGYDGVWPIKAVKHVFFWLEWTMFQEFIDHLFLPTIEIASLLPTSVSVEDVSALPPGCDSKSSRDVECNDEFLNLFYVGGVEPPYYDLSPLLTIVESVEGVRLILCCREREWMEHKVHYSEVSFEGNITVVHVSNEDIDRFYRWADIAADLREPTGYFKTAFPIKTVESLGFETPIMVRDGTSVASFVSKKNIGWTVNSRCEAKAMLEHLRDNRILIKEKIKNMSRVKSNHTWKARAHQAACRL